MPIHDWTRVNAGVYNAFQLGWVSELRTALNCGLLPPDHYAQAEPILGSRGPGLEELDALRPFDGAVVPALARWAVVIRHVSKDRIIALIEIVLPQSKSSAHAFRAFAAKAVEFLTRGYHLLVVDLVPRGQQNSHNLHAAIWREVGGSAYESWADGSLILAAYSVGSDKVAYLEPTAVGRELLDLPLFLAPDKYLTVPLEATYLAAYRGLPRHLKQVLEAPAGA